MENPATERILKASTRRTSCSKPLKIRQADGSHAYVRCQSKKVSDCLSCSTLNATDQKRLIGSGCNASERDGITTEMLKEYRFYFVTMTAPSFGGIHRVPKTKSSPAVTCSCGSVHKHGSEQRGTATKPRFYRYSDQVRWNQASSELFRRSMRYTEDLLPEFEWSFAREWQVRGALHFHGIVRVPAVYDEVTTWQALQRIRTYTYGDFSWGKEFDVQGITGDGATGSVRYMAKVVSYTAKQQGDEGLISEARREHHARLDKHAARIVCSSRGCKGDGRCNGAAHRSFGYGGQMITRSKGWSLVGLTRGSLVQERRKYAEQNANGSHQQELEILAKWWDADRRAVLQRHSSLNGLDALMAQEIEDSFFGKTAGESTSTSSVVATAN